MIIIWHCGCDQERDLLCQADLNYHSTTHNNPATNTTGFSNQGVDGGGGGDGGSGGGGGDGGDGGGGGGIGGGKDVD